MCRPGSKFSWDDHIVVVATWLVGIAIPRVNRAHFGTLLQCSAIITDWQRYTGAYFCIVTCQDHHDESNSGNKFVQMFSLNVKRKVHSVLVSTRTGNPRTVGQNAWMAAWTNSGKQPKLPRSCIALAILAPTGATPSSTISYPPALIAK